MSKTFKSDLAVAQAAKLIHIDEIAEKLNVSRDRIEHYGKYKAKLPLDLISEKKVKKSNLILVTSLTPTPPGEGKTTVSIGLSEGLNKIGKRCTVVLREPSLGPVFGIKGGAAGGGYSQVVPMEDINLHFTGDFSAIEKANNLLSALVDNNLQRNALSIGIDPRTILWKRVMDMNDRSLRQIIIGLGGTNNGVPREDGFNITAASEIMAILCLCKDIDDLKQKMGNILLGFKYDGGPAYARELNAEGPMAILLKEAINPNLVQTLEGNPAIIHGGPFANIAQGTNSVIGTKMGMSLSDYVVTEAGFGSDLGAEKFLNIKCGYSGLKPKALVIVATVRALRHHGGVEAADINTPNLKAVRAGMANLDKHIENSRLYRLTPIVAINHFLTDSKAEIQFIQDHCAAKGVQAVLSKGWELGGNGTTELAQAVVDVIDSGVNDDFSRLYNWNSRPRTKIETIAENVYGADRVEFIGKARNDLNVIKDLGLDHLPVCIAKTQKSLSDNEKLLGRPEGFTITVREIEIAAGAGFIIPITGNMMRMPGLPARSAAEGMDIDAKGHITGLH